MYINLENDKTLKVEYDEHKYVSLKTINQNSLKTQLW